LPEIELRIPTLVKQVPFDGVNHYVLRPIFASYPTGMNRRYEQALVQYRNELRHYFRGFSLNRSAAESLNWYLADPKYTYKQYLLSFQAGKVPIKHRFGVVHFQVQGNTVVILPGFQNYMFIAKKEGRKVNIKAECQRVLASLIKDFRENGGAKESIEQFASTKSEFVTTIVQKVNIQEAPLKFDRSGGMDFFALMNQQSSFDGGVEVTKVGFNVNGKYPVELRRAYFREGLVDQLYNTVFKKENTPIAIVGKEGVGKHTLIEEVVFRYESGHYEGVIKDEAKQKIWHLDPNRIIAGMSIVGMWEKRFESILNYLTKKDKEKEPTDKLLIDNVVSMLRIGKSSQNDLTLSNSIKPYLEKRTLQMIAIATPAEWAILQEQDRSFADLFQVIRVEEPPMEDAIKMVVQQRKNLELEHYCRITIQAIQQLFTLHRNYLKHKSLPGSVMKLLSQFATKYKFKTIDMPEVRLEFKEYSGLQERIFDENLTFEKGEVEKTIAHELIGQPNVVSRYLMGAEDRLMRFDMNEYIDPYAVNRLIGDAHNPDGQLTGKVRYQPFGILLLDEIEKAHPKVHDLLLQVLDDGRLTDSIGRTVDFTNTIIIMTSNVGASAVNRQFSINKSAANDGAIYQKEVEKYFRPEFINRIDQILIFNALQFEHTLKIARLQIKELLKRDGFVRRTTILNISQDALEWVAQRGYNEQMGGRALKRQIERDLTTLSAEQLISTYSDAPILMDIGLQDGALHPTIHTLQFEERIEADWLPQLPDETQGRRFFGRLLKVVERLERSIELAEAKWERDSANPIAAQPVRADDLNWQYYDFKNKLIEVKERVKMAMLGFKDNYYRETPAIPLRLKGGTFIPRSDDYEKGVREHQKDQWFQKEALLEISDNYNKISQQFDRYQTEFIDNLLNVAFLKLSSKGFLSGEIDKVTFEIKSSIICSIYMANCSMSLRFKTK